MPRPDTVPPGHSGGPGSHGGGGIQSLPTSLWPDNTLPFWQALELDGLTVTNDIRRLSPPIVIVVPISATVAGGCITEVVYSLNAVAPGPEHADALKWLWTSAAPALLKHCPEVEFVPYNEYPALLGEFTGTVEV